MRACAAVIPVAVVAAILLLPSVVRAQEPDNPIVRENQQVGTSSWYWEQRADDINGQIKGYASATSVNQNESITFHVSVNHPQTYTISFYRMGWYNGSGARLRLVTDPIAGAPQPPCQPDATTGLIACNWAPGYTLNVPSDWTTGVYLALLTNADGWQNHAIFVVKDGRPAAFLYQQSVTTYQAYNDYPNDGQTGKSLYGYNSYGANTIAGDKRAVKVSFDRPYDGPGTGDLFNWEYNFIRWAERSGYDLTYTTDVDTHVSGAELLNHKAFLAVGHDEYWSWEMFDAAEAARNAGVNIGFFGADMMSAQIRFEPSASGVPNRIIVAYKNAAIDPVQGPTTTVPFRKPPVNRPEHAFRGIHTAGVLSNNAGFVVTNSAHWVYAGSGFQDGDVVPGIVGYEADFNDTRFPSPAGLTLLSQSPFTDNTGTPGVSHSAIYQAPSGAWVYSTGTMSWTWALDNHFRGEPTDARIQRTTKNVLDAFLTAAPPPVTAVLAVDVPATVTAGQAFVVSVTARDSQGHTVAGYAGTVHFNSADGSPGVVLPADTTLTDGSGSFSATLIRSGPQTLTVSDAANSLSTTVSIDVHAASATHLAIAAAATVIAGQPFAFAVTALDAFGNTDTAYAGSVHFTTTDTAAGVVLPANATLTNGERTFSATLIRAGAQEITATDTVAPGLTATLPVTVRAANATRFALSTSATPTAGQAFTYTVTALDAFGNTATAYPGTVRFTSSDTSPGVVLPANASLTNGQRVFSATLTRAGAQSITATDVAAPGLTGTLPVTVLPGIATNVVLGVPSTTNVGQAFNFTVTLKDNYGNVATGYRGTLRFTTSDWSPLVSLPNPYTFTAGNNGVHTFAGTLWTPGNQTITATDTVNASLRATSAPINVKLLGL